MVAAAAAVLAVVVQSHVAVVVAVVVAVFCRIRPYRPVTKMKTLIQGGHGRPDSWGEISLIHLPLSKEIVVAVGNLRFS